MQFTLKEQLCHDNHIVILVAVYSLHEINLCLIMAYCYCTHSKARCAARIMRYLVAGRVRVARLVRHVLAFIGLVILLRNFQRRRIHKRIPKEPFVLLYSSWGPHNDWGVEWLENSTANDNSTLLHLRNCPFKCAFTRDANKYESKADFVILPVDPFLLKNETIERISAYFQGGKRKHDQVWTAIIHEPPYYFNISPRIDSIFNWIASYRQDSDIYWPYGTVDELVLPKKHVKIKGNLRKKKLAAWLVSRCNNSKSQRELLVNELQKHIPVDVFGRCGKPCPWQWGKKCRQFIGYSYKFYLAFENSLCPDYVTEKFFTTLEHGAVPVVYGWSDYGRLAPRESFINALDFKTVKDLAEYLKFLDANDTEYLKYFAWTREFRVHNRYNERGLCRFCERAWRHMNEMTALPPVMTSLWNKFTSATNEARINVGAIEIIVNDSVCFNPQNSKAYWHWLNGQR